MREVAKQSGEEVAVILGSRLGSAVGGELEARSPFGRRRKFLSLSPAIAELVVRGAFLRILEHFVGFADFLKTRFRLSLFTHVRMVFARQLAVCAFDVVGGRCAVNLKDLIVILKFHLASSPAVRHAPDE